MKQVDDPVTGEIIVEDSGSGMDFETVTTVWLEPGTNYRASQKEDGDRTSERERSLRWLRASSWPYSFIARMVAAQYPPGN
jgi:hypothetical protein